jgi:hypothetical protein
MSEQQAIQLSEEERQIAQQQALAQATREGLMPSTYPDTSQDTYHLTVDERVEQLLEKTEEELSNLKPLEVLIPANSKLLRTGSIPAKKAEELEIDIDLILARIKMRRPEDSHTMSEDALYDSLALYFKSAIWDSVAGYRGKLVTEHRRTMRVEGMSSQRKKVLGIL